jgi:hypothetical protein
MAHHAVHLVAAAAIVAGLFAASWALERRPAGAATHARNRGGPRTREAWERSLFGLPSGATAATMPSVTAVRPEGRPLDVVAAAAAASFLAGAIHLAALPEHVGESLLFGAFFLACGAFQLATGFAVRARGTRAIWTAILFVNGAVIGAWILSRTAGVPAGPTPWIPERIGPLDAVATACEIALVALAVHRLRRGAVSPLDG